MQGGSVEQSSTLYVLKADYNAYSEVSERGIKRMREKGEEKEEVAAHWKVCK